MCNSFILTKGKKAFPKDSKKKLETEWKEQCGSHISRIIKLIEFIVATGVMQIRILQWLYGASVTTPLGTV